jgi:hypothetical protein
MAVSHHKSVAVFVALSSGRLKVVSNLGFQRLSEHPARSPTGNLVQVEQALFAALAFLV